MEIRLQWLQTANLDQLVPCIQIHLCGSMWQFTSIAIFQLPKDTEQGSACWKAGCCRKHRETCSRRKDSHQRIPCIFFLETDHQCKMVSHSQVGLYVVFHGGVSTCAMFEPWYRVHGCRDFFQMQWVFKSLYYIHIPGSPGPQKELPHENP